MAKATDEYRYVGNHAEEFMIGDKAVPVEPGGFVKLSEDDLDHPVLKEFKKSGLLLKVGEDK